MEIVSALPFSRRVGEILKPIIHHNDTTNVNVRYVLQAKQVNYMESANRDDTEQASVMESAHQRLKYWDSSGVLVWHRNFTTVSLLP